MTKEQERVLAQLEANDPHPERGEIKFATDMVVGDYFERESFKNNFEGVSERLYERWYTTGKPSLQRVYKDGLLDSHNSWYPNGQLFERCSYKNGLPDGLEERWFENGQLMERTHFCAGKLDGLREEWYYNGQLLSQCSFKNNTPSGLWKLWHDNGQMSSRYTYDNGKVDGLLERWHPYKSKHKRYSLNEASVMIIRSRMLKRSRRSVNLNLINYKYTIYVYYRI